MTILKRGLIFIVLANISFGYTQSLNTEYPKKEHLYQKGVNIALSEEYPLAAEADFEFMKQLPVWYNFYQEAKTNKWHHKITQLVMSQKPGKCLGEKVFSIQSTHAKQLRQENANNTFLIQGLISKDQEFTSLISEPLFMRVDSPYLFPFNQRSYKLAARITADKQYELYVSEVGKGQEQRLIATEAGDKPALLLFIGDLDTDGKLDFIIDKATNNTSKQLVLYLSSYARENELVAPMGLAIHKTLDRSCANK